jgi:hypothetical protein
MGAPSLQLAAVFAVTSLAGAWMFMKGVTAKMLERRTVRCRVCGGVVRRTCTCDRD